MRRFGLIILFLFFGLFTIAQTDVGLKLGVSPWNINHNFEFVSKPISLSYSGGLNIEQSIFKGVMGVLIGAEYTYCPNGIAYSDLTDQQNLLAEIYADQLNKRFVDVTHHEISIPFVFTLYYNQLRSGIGMEYNQYFFPDINNSDRYSQFEDYGIKAFTGARLSKRVAFSIGYYYGLKDVFQLSSNQGNTDFGAVFLGNMQQLEISFAFSLFNNMKDDRYFLGEYKE